jgi:glycosyltransferase EpsD
MNVLLIGTLDGVSGGVAQYVQNIVNNIESGSANFTLGSLIADRDKEKYINVNFEKFDMRYRIFDINKRLKELHSIVTRNSISIIHAHTQRAALLATLYSIKSGLKVVYTPHGLRCTQLKGFNAQIHKYLDKFILNKIDIITVLSNSELRSVKKINAKVTVNKVNTRIEHCEINTNKKCEFNQVVMVGSCEERKQPLLFIEIAKRCTIKNIKFIWIGKGDQFDECNRYAIEFLSDKLSFIGQKENLETKQLLSNSDLLLFTSKQEGFPITILEAMMLKVPIISNDFFGVEDIIKNRDTGLIFENSDIDQAVHLIEKVLKDQQLKDMLISNAYYYYEENHSSLKIFSNEFVTFYKNLI